MYTPTGLTIIENRFLQVTWSDGEVRRALISAIRRACPCATCKEKHKPMVPPSGRVGKTLLPTLSVAETLPLKINGMKPVGNYAYKIDFSDGHSSGLFTMELLRDLGSVVQNEAGPVLGP